MTGRKKAFAGIAIAVGIGLLVIAQGAAYSEGTLWLRVPLFVIYTIAGMTFVVGGGMFLWKHRQ
jgi:hypothetical protein